MQIRDLINELKNASDGDGVCLNDILNQLQGRSLGVMLTLLAFLNLIPLIGGLPGVPAISGVLIIAVCVQSVFAGRSSIWVPQSIGTMEVSREKLSDNLDRIKPWFVWLDNIVSPRVNWLVNRYFIALCAIFLAMMFFPLGFIPWGVSAPAAAIMFLGLSLMGKDGIFAAMGYGFSVLSLWLVWTYVPSVVTTVTGCFGSGG